MQIPDPGKFTDPIKLRKLAINARRLGETKLALDCQLRIAELAGQPYEAGMEREFWTAVSWAEEYKSVVNGKNTKLTKVRAKHKRAGTVQCLIDWAKDPEVTDGFDVLIAAGHSDLTGEAIVVRHAEMFDPEIVAIAERKLSTERAAPVPAE
ncbi:MAG: hypothetical protein JWR75_1505 [Devosia sp.]|nr:hypothetical protein [Devosia sp.]